MSESNTIAVQIPDVTLKLSDAVQIAVSEIHPNAWPGLINGVLRNLNSEASRAVINRIHGVLETDGINGHFFVKDTKANKEANKEPTSTAFALEMRKLWRERNAETYDSWMAEAESELVDTLRDGTFRVREAAGPRVASMSPEEARARDMARAKFDDVLLPKAGYDLPKTKAGNRFAPKGKQLAGLEIKTSQGVKLYPDALEAFFGKNKAEYMEKARKALDRERADAAKSASTIADGAEIDLG
jgi:hypothetical protein